MQLIHYTLQLDAPLLVTAPGGDPNANRALPYVPGSVIRGAIASKIKDKEGETFSRLILSDEVLFLNAYPVTPDGHATLPLPKNKKLVRKAGADPQHKPDKSKIYFDPQNPSDADTDLFGVAYQMNIHHARNREEGRPVGGPNGGALFRYEALADGQTFAGKITANRAEDADKIFQILCNSRIFLGGSQSADYGAVTVNVNNPIAFVGAARTGTDRTYIYLVSDGIFRHPQTGQVGPYFAEALADAIGLTGSSLITIDAARYDWGGGFNRKWGLPIQQNHYVESGSTVYIAGPISQDVVDKLHGLEQSGLGERRNEGFGQILVGPVIKMGDQLDTEWHSDRWTASPLSSDSDTDVENVSSVPATAVINTLNSRIAKREIERYLLAAAQNIAKNARVRSLNASQIGRMRVRLRGKQAQAGDLSDFHAYLEETKARSVVDTQFRKAKIQRVDMRDWLQKHAGDTGHLWDLIEIAGGQSGWRKEGKTVSKRILGNERYQVSEEDTNRYMVRLLELLLTHLAHGKRREDGGK